MIPDNPPLTAMEELTPSPKILIVDDSENDRRSFVRYLQSDPEQSYYILEAETLEEGLELWRSQKPDIVLLDINLPDGNGLEFLEAIRTEQLINKLPVIMLTGQGDERIAVRAMKLGAADYLIKGDMTAISLLTCIHQAQANNLLQHQLRRSQQQQSIIASMALHIRRSISFEEVANAIVQEIRSFLEADRTIIYRFNPDMSGTIVAEAIIPPWEPCLNAQVEDTCFQKNLGGEYKKGKVFVATDIYEANLTACHIKLLERFQVRANLVVPILLDGNNILWGLLIAHQCSAPRQWLEEDVQLLHQLSVHLSLALQQAELYQNLESLNSSLEEKVQERTQTLQLQNRVLEEIHDAVVTTALDGSILSWNTGAETLYGYTKEEVLGQNIALIYQDTDTLQAEVIGPLLEKGNHTAEVVLFSKSGKRINIDLRLSVVKDEQGNITHLIGCSNDITQRKRTEQALQELNEELEERVEQRTIELRESERRFASLAAAAPVGIFRMNRNNECIYVNEFWSEITGRASDVALGYGWRKTIHPDDQEQVRQRWSQVIAQRATYQGEGRCVRPDGTNVFFYCQALPEIDKDGNFLGYIGTLTDISDRKRIEMALMESEEKFRRLVEGAKDLIWSTDANWRFTYLSPQFQPLFGFEPNDWIGKSVFELVYPEDLDLMADEYLQALQSTKQFSRTEFRHRHQDGHYLWVSVNTTLILNDNGIAIGAQGILTDISDRKLAEVQLKQKNIELEELVKLREEALTLREDMSNMIVHDLRNPLSAILLAAEIIKKYSDRPNNQTALVKKADQILTSGKRLYNMIDSLLLMAKLESGKILLNPVSTDLHELGNDILRDFELTANNQSLELQSQLPDPGTSLVIDAIILRRVIENLLSNALKFSPPNGQVCLTIQGFPNNHLRVQVSDQGPGVTPEQTENIFKKFEVGTLKPNVSQIGLGLAFCKMAVEAQDGTLAIAPNQPNGSILTVEI